MQTLCLHCCWSVSSSRVFHSFNWANGYSTIRGTQGLYRTLSSLPKTFLLDMTKKIYELIQRGHTNSKQFYPSILQALGRRNHIVLGLPISDEDSYFWNTRPGPRFYFEAVFQYKGESQTWIVENSTMSVNKKNKTR